MAPERAHATVTASRSDPVFPGDVRCSSDEEQHDAAGNADGAFVEAEELQDVAPEEHEPQEHDVSSIREL